VIQTLFSSFPKSPKARSEALLRAAMTHLPQATLYGDSGMVIVSGPPTATYRPSVYAWAEDDGVYCLATAQIVVDRDWLPHELLLQLLEENHPERPGRFWLMNWKGERMVTLAEVLPPGLLTADALARRIEALRTRFADIVQRLYALDLLITGPEPYSSGSSPP